MAGDGGDEAAFDADHISSLIQKSKAQRAEYTFGFGLGSKPEDCALIVHLRKPGKALKGEVKGLPGKIGKACFGTFGVVENEVRFCPARPVKGMVKQLKKRFRDAGLAKWKPVLVGPDGAEIDEDSLPDDLPEDDDDSTVADVAPPEPLDLSPLKRRLAALIRAVQAMPPGDVQTRLVQACRLAAQQIAQEQAEGADKTIAAIEAALERQKPQGEAEAQGEEPPAAPPPPNAEPQVPLAKLQEALTGLVQRIRALADTTAQGMLGGQAREIVGFIRDGAVERAIAAMRTLATDLAAAEKGAAGGTSDTSGATALDTWNSAREEVDRGIEKLQSAIRGMGDPDLDRIAEYGLNGVTEGVQSKLMAALFDFQRAAGPARPAAAQTLRKRAQEARSLIESDEVIALCDDNPFGIPVTIRATLGAALTEIERLAA
jgi:hypothetical protein